MAVQTRSGSEAAILPAAKERTGVFRSSGSSGKAVLGHLGELLAADRLRREGYVILERNYRCRQGEIDMIAREDGVLVFVEVRTRSGDGFGSPLESVDFFKQRRLRDVARHYLRERRPVYQDVRFDVVGIVLKEGEEARVDIVPHAFYQGQFR